MHGCGGVCMRMCVCLKCLSVYINKGVRHVFIRVCVCE